MGNNEENKTKAQVISISTQKGGAGKTTTAVTFATLLSLLAKKVLLIDMDPQGNATSVISGRSSREKHYDKDGNWIYHKGVYELFLGDEDPHDLIHESPYGCREVGMILDYIPAGDGLSDLADVLTSQVERAKTYSDILDRMEEREDAEKDEKLRDAYIVAKSKVLSVLQFDETEVPDRLKVAAVKNDVKNLHNYTVLKTRLKPLLDDYDYIIMDQNPSRNLVSMNAMAAATGIISPANADGFSSEGVVTILDDVDKMREYNPDVEFRGVLLTSVKPKTKVAIKSKAALEFFFNGRGNDNGLCERAIRMDNAVIESNTNMCPIFMSDKKRTNAGADYIHAAYDLKIITLDERDKLLKIFAPLKDTYDFKIGG